jgi:hypothetical protein
MRLGAVFREGRANAFYRMYLPMLALQARGHEIVVVPHEGERPLPLEQLLSCDLVHIHRPLLAAHDDCVARLHDAGVAVGFDDDADNGAAPDELESLLPPGTLAQARRDFAQRLARAPEVDLVTVPSDDLADRFEQAGARNVAVIDNYLPGEFGRVAPVGHDGLAIGWHALPTHAIDVEPLRLGATLRRVLVTHEDVRVVTLGIDLALDHERYHCEQFVPVQELTRWLVELDVGIAPLTDTPFNRARSDVKLREYAAAGVPWLASPVGSYAHRGAREGGRLVEDDAWFDAIDALIRSRRERAKLAKRAKAWADLETMWNMAGVWERTFQDAIAGVRAAA